MRSYVVACTICNMYIRLSKDAVDSMNSWAVGREGEGQAVMGNLDLFSP